MTDIHAFLNAQILTDALIDKVPGLREADIEDTKRVAKEQAQSFLRQWENLPEADQLYAALLAKPDSTIRRALEKIDDTLDDKAKCFMLVGTEWHFANVVMHSEVARHQGKFPPTEAETTRSVRSRRSYTEESQKPSSTAHMDR